MRAVVERGGRWAHSHPRADRVPPRALLLDRSSPHDQSKAEWFVLLGLPGASPRVPRQSITLGSARPSTQCAARRDLCAVRLAAAGAGGHCPPMRRRQPIAPPPLSHPVGFTPQGSPRCFPREVLQCIGALTSLYCPAPPARQSPRCDVGQGVRLPRPTPSPAACTCPAPEVNTQLGRYHAISGAVHPRPTRLPAAGPPVGHRLGPAPPAHGSHYHEPRGLERGKPRTLGLPLPLHKTSRPLAGSEKRYIPPRSFLARAGARVAATDWGTAPPRGAAAGRAAARPPTPGSPSLRRQKRVGGCGGGHQPATARSVRLVAARRRGRPGADGGRTSA